MTPRRPVARINRPVRTVPVAAPAARLRVGLLGGSFDPAHEGHRAISLEALRRLRLDRVWWLVSPHNPLKPAGSTASLDDRLASARAVADHPRIRALDLERRLGTRYSVDTMRALRKRSRARFVWLIGADLLAQLPRWHAWRTLVGLVPIAVLDREPYSYRALAGQAAQRYASRRRPEREAAILAERRPPAWVFLRARRHKASSTAIRRHRRAPRPGGRKEKPS
ncbi:MAG: nicotinate-nucleotide adenylyltransferase [Geminicoccaceae bacterium]